MKSTIFVEIDTSKILTFIKRHHKHTIEHGRQYDLLICCDQENVSDIDANRHKICIQCFDKKRHKPTSSAPETDRGLEISNIKFLLSWQRIASSSWFYIIFIVLRKTDIMQIFLWRGKF